MNKDELQELLKTKYLEYGKSGTLVASMGSSKTRTAIKIADELRCSNVLVISPKKLLTGKIKGGNSWEKELEKYPSKTRFNYITIQGVIKWNFDKLKQFDFIIIDEIEECATEGKLPLFEAILSYNIRLLGLTGTPNENNEFKASFYEKYCPIIYRYLDSAKDGIINKTKIYVLNHQLNNDIKYTITTKKKDIIFGELEAYNYFDKTMNHCKQVIETKYYNEVKLKAQKWLNSNLDDNCKLVIKELINGDLNNFRETYWKYIKEKKLPYKLYKAFRDIQGDDYAKFGMKASFFAAKAPDDIKQIFYKYQWALKQRKDLLLRLDSTANAANIIANRLNNCGEKVLIFSEENDQVSKITDNCYFSKNSAKVNKENLAKFESKEELTLGCSKALSLGVNLTNLKYAILESFVGSETRNSQSAGRLNRLDVNQLGVFIVILVKDTVQEEWFEKILPSFNCDDIVYFDDINELIKEL